MYGYVWNSSSVTLLSVVDVLDPLKRVREGYVLEATVVEDNDPRGQGMVIGDVIIMRRAELRRYGAMVLVSRRVGRG